MAQLIELPIPDESLAPYFPNRIADVLSAKRVLTRGQKIAGLVIALLVILAAVANLYLLVEYSLVFMIVFVYLSVIAFRCLMFVVAQHHALEDVTQEVVATFDRASAPKITVLVPLFAKDDGEIAVWHAFFRHFALMDYSPMRLDGKILIEATDQRAQYFFRTQADCLPDYWEILIVPRCQPQTKPKACNFGLERANSEITVIFDAEDRPDTDQLIRAAIAYQKAGKQSPIVCWQAKLLFENHSHNWLTCLFTAEYGVHYSFFLPGLCRLGLPVPLGGTSNYFRTDFLIQYGGWDAYNTTEDCDLGIRLARAGFQVRMINSVTWEEATSWVPIFVKQRSRWIKGYIQTALVHMRHPFRLYRELGVVRTAAFCLTVCSVPVSLAASPLFWLQSTVYVIAVLAGWSGITEAYHRFYPGWLLYVGVFCFGPGNVLLCFMSTLSILDYGPEEGGSVVWVIIGTPVYWLLTWIATYKALYQLIGGRAHFWELTAHGHAQNQVTKVSVAD